MGAAVTAQQTFRFREDDGSLTEATWLGAGNGSDISRGTGTANKFRIRFVVEETNGGNANEPWLLYASYEGGSYFQITTSSNYIRLVASSYVSDGVNIPTAELGWSGTYNSDTFDSDGTKANNALQSEYGEPEYCLYIVDADVANDDTIDLRVYEAVGVPIDGYADTPRVTVVKGGVDPCTADSLLAGTPVLGTPDIGQEHVLSTGTLVAGTPVLGTPDIGQEHVLGADDLDAGTPVLGTPTVAEGHVLTADDLLAGTPVLGTPDIGQEHALAADDLDAGTPVLGTPDIGQVHALTATDLVAGTPVLGTPECEEGVHACQADDLLAGTPVLGTPDIGQTHVLVAVSLVAGTPVLGTPELAEGQHALSADDLLAGTPVLGTPALGVEGVVVSALLWTVLVGVPISRGG
jgi:hypothetical protein